MPRKKKGRPFARIAITLPPEVLAAADRMAREKDRSRSWVVAEAIRRFSRDDASSSTPAVLHEPRAGYTATPGLGPLRLLQLEADLRLTPGERVRAAEETRQLAELVRPTRGQQVLCFERPEDYFEWKKRVAVGL